MINHYRYDTCCMFILWSGFIVLSRYFDLDRMLSSSGKRYNDIRIIWKNIHFSTKINNKKVSKNFTKTATNVEYEEHTVHAILAQNCRSLAYIHICLNFNKNTLSAINSEYFNINLKMQSSRAPAARKLPAT